MNVGVGLTSAHMAFIVRRFERIVAFVSAGSVCLMTVSVWHTTGRATCQQSVLRYGLQHIVLYSDLSQGVLQGSKPVAGIAAVRARKSHAHDALV